MSLTLNMVGGAGGLSPNAAVIHVTAPVGSTISFSKGGIVAKVLPPEKSHVNAEDNTIAEWYYAVAPSNYGSWTVSAALNGGGSNSRSVSVSSAKQYDVSIPTPFYYVTAGVLSGQNIVSVGKKGSSASSANAVAPPVSYGDGYIECGWTSYGTAFQTGIIYFPEQVDLSKYSRVKVNGRFVFYVKSSTGSTFDVDHLSLNGWSRIGTYSNDNRIFNYCPVTASNQTYDYTGVWEVDLSAVEDKTNAFIGMKFARNTSNSNTYARIIDCWLE